MSSTDDTQQQYTYAIYVEMAGGGYEIYDPYTGIVTPLMGPPPGHYQPVGHPMLAAMSYQPMPMQPVDWYNPSNVTPDWMSGGTVYQPNNRHHKRSTTADVQQVTIYLILMLLSISDHRNIILSIVGDIIIYHL